VNRKLISADSHICEPPEIWRDRLPARLKDRAPRVITLDGRPGEFFACEDIQPRSVFAAAAAGVASEDLPARAARGFAAAPDSIRDAHARIAEQDRDGISAEVLYPTFADLIFGVRDVDLRQACFRAYNDFVIEHTEPYPDRLLGAALVDTADLDWALREARRALAAGLRTVVVRGDSDVDYGAAEYDPLWALAVEHGVPITIHRGAVRSDVTVDVRRALREYMAIPHQAQRALTDMVLGGVWERHADLRLVLCEFDLLWVPHFLQRLAHADERYGAPFGLGLSQPAVDQIRQSVWMTFQHETDELAAIADQWPSDRLLWASDYPHAESSYPHSSELVELIAERLGEKTTEQVTYGNVAELYGLTSPESSMGAA